MSDFYQEGPTLKPEYTPFVREVLRQSISPGSFENIDKDLELFAKRCVGEINDYANASMSCPPQLVQYSPWGLRIDEIQVHSSWRRLQDIAAEEGLIAIGYERKLAEDSRAHQYAKLFLFHPSSAFFSCPLAMTDGAARVLELLDNKVLKERAYSRLTSRDPKKFWTSGQWMTEKEGGSDVSRTSTVARAQDSGKFELSGVKWFSSATTSEMALALARVDGDQKGSRGLSLFYLEMRDRTGKLNGIKINRLKDKLGTKALPTAELELDKCKAQMLGEQGQGVKNITTMLNTTRLHNAICSCGQMARSVNLSEDYSQRRFAFGKIIDQHFLHQQTLANMKLNFSLGFGLTFKLVSWLGREELGQLDEIELSLFRLLTPIAKLYTAKLSVEVATACVESFGGAGYIEDTGVPLMLRDAQVFPIWEGTTNILSLDILRVLSKEPKSLEMALSYMGRSFSKNNETQREYLSLLERDKKQLLKWSTGENELLEVNACELALFLGRSFATRVLLDHAENADSVVKSHFISLSKLAVKELKERALYGYSTEDRQNIDAFLA